MSIKVFFLFFLLLSSTKCSEESSFMQFLKGFIQNHLPNYVLVDMIELLRKRNKKNFPDNFQKNQEAFKNHLPTIKRNGGYIEDQSKYSDMAYGAKQLSYNGCGLIATYNVIFHLTGSYDIDFPTIVKTFENDGIILNGYFGTSMVAIRDYFNKKGYRATGSSKNEDFNSIGNQYDACIITVYNDINDITNGMHFIAVTKKNGKYTVHNNGSNSSSVVYTSIDDVMKRINSGKAKGVYIVGVSK